MERLLALARKGKDETLADSFEARKELGLVPLRAALYVDEFPIPLDKIRNHFAVASRVRVVADLTATNTLAEAAKQLEEYALFAASHKFKKDLNCKLLPDKILVELGAYFTAMEKWFGEIGEPRQREVIKMKEGIQAAI